MPLRMYFLCIYYLFLLFKTKILLPSQPPNDEFVPKLHKTNKQIRSNNKFKGSLEKEEQNILVSIIVLQMVVLQLNKQDKIRMLSS